ncbi:organomercurial lyase [Streptomyces sp. NPDC004728]|uniref:organomercurial lyase n=1 Tax=Streptomyces sp. NPDC004728 TaxID=3154289 RepID=UPI0033A24CC9
MLQPEAAGVGRTVTEVLVGLADEEFRTLDEAGNIRAAYPFSVVLTRHKVRLESGAEVWSMCVIDALGIPAMLGKDAVITSTDPVSGEPITVTSTAGMVRWRSGSAVVFVGQRPGGGPAASGTLRRTELLRSSSRSSVLTPAAWPLSISCWVTQRRTDSRETPRDSATWMCSARSEEYSARCSVTSRTAWLRRAASIFLGTCPILSDSSQRSGREVRTVHNTRKRISDRIGPHLLVFDPADRCTSPRGDTMDLQDRTLPSWPPPLCADGLGAPMRHRPFGST